MKKTILTTLLSISALLFSVAAQARPLQDPTTAESESMQPAGDDPIRQLNLTPEQRQKIRIITEGNREERQRINRQFRDARFALDQILDSDSPSEELVEQRIRALADAHAAQIRMRAIQELKIRSVLTPEQVNIWRQLRARNQAPRRRLDNADRMRNTPRNLPGQQNGLAPFPRGERRRPRP